MANHTSSKKMIRKIARRTEVNRSRVSAIRTAINKVEKQLESKEKQDKKTLQTSLRDAESLIMKGVSNGVLKRNTARRTVSRLVKKAKAHAA